MTEQPTKQQPVVTKEAKAFYSMIAMFVCASDIGEYIVNSPEPTVVPAIKDKIRGINGTIRRFMGQMLKKLPEKDVALWKKEWIDRDYNVYQSVFSMMSDMTDEQRLGVEEFCEQVLKGNIKMVAE